MSHDEVEASGFRLDSSGLRLIEKVGGRRAQQVLTAVAALQTVAPAVKWAREQYQSKEHYKITVFGTDDIYSDLSGWVLTRMPEYDRKAMVAHTISDQKSDAAAGLKRSIALRYDGSKTQDVNIDGHVVEVKVEKEEIPAEGALSKSYKQMLEKISFTSPSVEGRDAVVKMISGLVAAKYMVQGPPPLFMASKWGGHWNQRGDLPARTLESVILKDGQLERLVADLERFLEAEEEYNRVSQPWHRGYLFHGAPGTGKTSVARALANHFNIPVYYLPLGDMDSDADLIGLVAAIEPRSMLLLEDIDVFKAATDRKDEKGESSVASMLNTLDGVWTPHGLVTVMTTNKKKNLDKALIRPGRIDVDEKFTNLDKYQANQLTEWFGGHEVECEDFIGKSPAELLGALRG